jgi:penicillin-binding protein 1A
MKFDKVSKKKATACTPPGAVEELDVVKNVDPLTKQVIYTPPEGYDAEHDDDVHHCGTDQSPFVSDVMSLNTGETGKYYIITHVRAGTNPVSNVTISFNGQSYNASQYSDGGWRIIVQGLPGSFNVNVSVTDSAYYTAEGSDNINFSGM